jgi:hypothetical protein
MRLDDVLAIFDALEREGVRYAVFGAIALAAHGLDRATRDLDLFVHPDEKNVARLHRALQSVFDDPEVLEITAEALAGDYPVIQYGPPDVDYTIDIAARLGEAFAFEDLDIVTVELDEGRVQVVSPETLYRMKCRSVRPHDRADAERLRRHLDLED